MVGGGFCEHVKKKIHCKPCGGRNVCRAEHCETQSNPRRDEGYCIRCFVNLFPEKPNARNYKTKESSVATFLQEKFPNVTWVHDKKIEGGCSRRRPDLFLDMGSHVVIVEVDENKNDAYDFTCENKRLTEISQDLNHRCLVMIRWCTKTCQKWHGPEEGQAPGNEVTLRTRPMQRGAD